jgi:hypothetical protein
MPSSAKLTMPALCGGRGCGRFLRQEALEVVLLALELLPGGFVRRLDARARRGLDAVDFLDPEGLAFLVHPKILFVRSIPRSSAATSSSSE